MNSKIQRSAALPAATVLCTALAAVAAHATPVPEAPQFQRIASFNVCENTSCDREAVPETVAEITAVSQDGKILVYTDSPQGVVGFVDISNPWQPKGRGVIGVGGEPTSVAVAGGYALAVVNTSSSFANPGGHLAVYDIAACVADLATCVPVATLDLQGQPDSLAVSPDGRYAAIAIENERDEDVTVGGVEGGLPQSPPGYLAIVDLVGAPAAWSLRKVDLTGLATYAPEDPEPEFVSINAHNVVAVTLQENNHIVLVDLATGAVTQHFDAGKVTLRKVDSAENGLIEFNATLPRIPREPDGIAWLDTDHIATANEGDLFGGSRGFSIFASSGAVDFDAGRSFDYLAIRHGHFPEARADAKGSEPEGVVVAQYGARKYVFVGSERGNFVAVYEMDGGKPVVRQLLPTGIAPEGLLAIPQRDLFVASTENDEEWRAQINIFRLRDKVSNYPSVISGQQLTGPLAGKAPIPWGALSGLAPHPKLNDWLYAVPDSYYKQSRIYRMHVGVAPALIRNEIVLKKAGTTVDYDLEGIATCPNGRFWLVSEGDGTAARPNLLIEADTDGTVLREIHLPVNVEALQKSNGYEGVAVTRCGADAEVFVAFQREWKGDPDGQVRIGRYHLKTDEWRFFYYPLEAVASPAGGWVGLSELVSLGGERFAVIERDNQGGPDARIKKVFGFSIAGLTPQPQGGVFPVVGKHELLDLLPRLASYKGWVLDKVEGLAVALNGKAYAVTDNDGVDDASGETRLLRLGPVLH